MTMPLDQIEQELALLNTWQTRDATITHSIRELIGATPLDQDWPKDHTLQRIWVRVDRAEAIAKLTAYRDAHYSKTEIVAFHLTR